MKYLHIYSFISLLFVSTAVASAIRTITVDGLQREFHIYQPQNINTPVPLLMVFHGGGGNAEKMRDVSQFDVIAGREKFIVVYAQSHKGHWNDGRKSTSDGVNDIAYVNAIISLLVDNEEVDKSSVFATGISNGGFFTQRLACESSSFKAYASVVATMGLSLYQSCKPSNAINILMINGREDTFVPWGGGEVKKGWFRGKGGKIVSVDKMMAFWRSHNQCERQRRMQLENKDTQDNTLVTQVSYNSCRDGVTLQQLDIEGGGHIWPGYPLKFFGRRLLGNSSMDIDASEEIWGFFENTKGLSKSGD
ncbi:MAG: hydrolase [endosymbiont of Galathealinum brachiosum]|uniref:Hydrolase n=1 Tax=endosymbiont of Galathealinum brachiosum TaxID=2200906 RepID=A0A370DK17_9GAMM|nr:MAG: hydrolase [endosymbiont of Galathealinum brachiosum]